MCYYTNFSVAVLMSVYLSATSVYPLIAAERNSFLLLKLLPVKMSRFIWNKIFASGVFITLFSQIMNRLGISRHRIDKYLISALDQFFIIKVAHDQWL